MRTPFLSLLLCGLLIGCNGGSATTGTGAGGPGGGPPGGGPGGGTTAADAVLAVVTSDNDLDGVRQLFAVTRRGVVFQLSSPLGATHDVGAVAPSPDGSLVAFAVSDGAQSGLYVTGVAAAAPALLSAAGVTIREIVWSPDGLWIAFRAEVAGGEAVFLVRPDGTGLRNLTDPAQAGSVLRWSFDGAWLAFRMDQDVAGRLDLYVVRPDGSGLRRVATTSSPVWSPTANCIAYDADPGTGDKELLVLDVDAGGPAVVLSTETDTTGSVSINPRWSPDGSALVYRRRTVSTGANALFVVSKVGGDARSITDGVTDPLFEWAWNTDGTRIAFRTRTTLYVSDGGGAPTDLVTDTFLREMGWAADGTLLGVLAGDFSSQDLLVVEAAGGVPLEVATDVATYAWARDASTLAGRPPPRLRAVLPETADRDHHFIEAVLEGDPFAVRRERIGSIPGQGVFDYEWDFGDDGTPAPVVGSDVGDGHQVMLRPIAADLDGDGEDDAGLFAATGIDALYFGLPSDTARPMPAVLRIHSILDALQVDPGDSTNVFQTQWAFLPGLNPDDLVLLDFSPAYVQPNVIRITLPGGLDLTIPFQLDVPAGPTTYQLDFEPIALPDDVVHTVSGMVDYGTGTPWNLCTTPSPPQALGSGSSYRAIGWTEPDGTNLGNLGSLDRPGVTDDEPGVVDVIGRSPESTWVKIRLHNVRSLESRELELWVTREDFDRYFIFPGKLTAVPVR